jgi:GNAT superfamily N-acetyltransferase
VRIDLGDGYEVDDDRDRIDVDAVHAFLTQAYWALGRSREVVADIARTSARVVGVYHHGAQIGYARVLSDRHTTAYLADVYVLEEHRGRGLGRALVGATVDGDPQLAPLRWLLHTRDMHRLYREFGFQEPDFRFLERL